MRQAQARQTGSARIIGLVVLLLIIVATLAGGGAWLLTGQQGARAATPIAKPVMPATPIFVKVAPFTVNLDSDACGPVLLYTGMTLKVADSDTAAFLNEHMPQVRSRLLMLLSGQDARELISPQGKQTLADGILEMLSTRLTDPQPTLAIDEVLFTEFIVQ